MRSNHLRDAALAYAEAGWRIFPCSRAKIPLVRDWPNVATTDAAKVAQWWQANPSASIGFATGPLVVIDIDGPKGLETRRETEAEGLEWPVTLTSTTGRREGGAHLYYVPPAGVEIRNAVWREGAQRGIGPGVDVRGWGGLTILPPSRHSSERRYRWALRHAPVLLPSWMQERLKTPERRAVEPAPVTSSTRYVNAVLARELEAVATAPEGTLNDRLNTAAYALGRFVGSGELGEDETFEALLSAATGAGHPERGAANTIKSGLRAGMGRAT